MNSKGPVGTFTKFLILCVGLLLISRVSFRILWEGAKVLRSYIMGSKVLHTINCSEVTSTQKVKCKYLDDLFPVTNSQNTNTEVLTLIYERRSYKNN